MSLGEWFIYVVMIEKSESEYIKRQHLFYSVCMVLFSHCTLHYRHHFSPSMVNMKLHLFTCD